MKPLPKNFKFSRDPRFTPAGLSPERLSEIEEIAIQLVDSLGAGGKRQNAYSGYFKGEGDDMAGAYVEYYLNYDGHFMDTLETPDVYIRDIHVGKDHTPDYKYLKTCCNYVLACRKADPRPSPTRGSMKYGYDYGTY